MQTKLSAKILQSDKAPIIDSILRSCVHCGFCNATCPTYQLLGDELDGPRGRIYQMKQFFEGAPANSDMLKHLDRCLTCRSCETTCPSGVEYNQLLEIGREFIEQELPRSAVQYWFRRLIIYFIYSEIIFKSTIVLARLFSPFLPQKLRTSIPKKQLKLKRLESSQSSKAFSRKVLLLSGCVQSYLTPNTNQALENVLNHLEVEVIAVPAKQCCGSAAMHSSQPGYGQAQARHLIDLWWPHVEAGVDAIIVSASGCGLSIREYPRVFKNDAFYAAKAQKIAELCHDPLEIIQQQLKDKNLNKNTNLVTAAVNRVAVHTPCTMQHGLGINRQIEKVLAECGFEICAVKDAHICCGSAGTYSILQAKISTDLRRNKQQALNIDQPDVIVTANVGCQLQLANGSEVPVRHWIELINDRLGRCDQLEKRPS